MLGCLPYDIYGGSDNLERGWQVHTPQSAPNCTGIWLCILIPHRRPAAASRPGGTFISRLAAKRVCWAAGHPLGRLDHVRITRFRPWCTASGEDIPRFAKFCPAQLSHRSASEQATATCSLRAASFSALPLFAQKSRNEILSVQERRRTASGKGFQRLVRLPAPVVVLMEEGRYRYCWSVCAGPTPPEADGSANPISDPGACRFLEGFSVGRAAMGCDLMGRDPL